MCPTVIPVGDEASSEVVRRGATTVTVLPISVPLSHTLLFLNHISCSPRSVLCVHIFHISVQIQE